jgi:peptide/nickel transport system permease protein
VSARASDGAFAISPLSARLDRVRQGVRRITADPMGALGLWFVLLIVLTGIFADLIAPYDPIAQDIKGRLADPSWQHWLGTDQLGRDTLSRVIKGTQIALGVAVSTTLVSMLIGLVFGLVAGYGPRWLDNSLMLLFDTVYSFPSIMLALAIVTVIGPSLGTVLLVIVIGTVPAYARLVRTSTLAVKEQEFIAAERAMGARSPRVLFRHILPNVIGPLLIICSMDVPVVVTVEAGLSFLGLGVRAPAPSWGRILNEGYAFVRNSPWMVIAAGLPLAIPTLGFTFLGEALRDAFDPKLRRRF